MIEIEDVYTCNWSAAVRGMRNPLESWDKSDSEYVSHYSVEVGPKDLNLMERLIKAGSSDRKFMRMIIVSMDINAPLYWWKEFDTYKVGTVTNSCSTMHTLGKRLLKQSDFAMEYLDDGTDFNTDAKLVMTHTLAVLNDLIYKWSITKDKKYWDAFIQLLPSSFMQKRTVTMNYEVLRKMCHERKNHKLSEWRDFCDYFTGEDAYLSLPYPELLTEGFSKSNRGA